MNISIANDQSDLPLSELKVARAIECVLKFLQVHTDEVSVCFVDRETICALHEEHFDDPSFTDCITFPIDNEDDAPGPHFLGEMIVCPAYAIEYAANNNTAPYDEVLLYLVHCICHLLGYDDLTEPERLKIRAEEARILEHLKEENIDLCPE